MMADRSNSVEPIVIHNTKALEEAILSSVKAASIPTYKALSDYQFSSAKALLLKVVTICVVVVSILLVVLLIANLFWGTGEAPKNKAPENVEPIVSDAVPPKKNVENRIREILEDRISKEKVDPEKSRRTIKRTSSISQGIVNPSTSIGSDLVMPDQTSSQTSTVSNGTVEIENMVVGPEVQTLTVFKSRDVTLANGLKVEIVAGHRYANNSSTQYWREGYCYVTWFDEINIQVNLADKPGSSAKVVDNYINSKELGMLGGLREVENLRALCPWIS